MSFPDDLLTIYTLVDNEDDVLSSHPNTLSAGIRYLEDKVGVDSSVVATTIDYFLKHASGAYRTHVHDGGSDDGANIPIANVTGLPAVAGNSKKYVRVNAGETSFEAVNIDGSEITGLGNIGAGAGTIPVANLPTGTTANKIVQLDGSAKLPAVDGSQLTGLAVAWSDYSVTSTVTGWSSFSTKNIYTKKIGTTVFVEFFINGTSNDTVSSFTLPYTAGGQNFGGAMITAYNASSLLTTATRCYLAGSTVTCYSNMGSGAWTGSGTKLVHGQFWYEATS